MWGSTRTGRRAVPGSRRSAEYRNHVFHHDAQQVGRRADARRIRRRGWRKTQSNSLGRKKQQPAAGTDRGGIDDHGHHSRAGRGKGHYGGRSRSQTRRRSQETPRSSPETGSVREEVGRSSQKGRRTCQSAGGRSEETRRRSDRPACRDGQEVPGRSSRDEETAGGDRGENTAAHARPVAGQSLEGMPEAAEEEATSSVCRERAQEVPGQGRAYGPALGLGG